MGCPDFSSVKAVFEQVENLISQGRVLSCWTLGAGGAAEGIMKMMLGNQIGFELDKTFNENELFAQCYGAFLCELDKPLEMPGSAILLGHTTKGYSLKTGSATIQMDKLQKIYEDKLQPVFPYLSQEEEKPGPDLFLRRANPASGIQNG